MWRNVLDTNPTFGFAVDESMGGTVRALQFTDAGTVYDGMNIDVNVFPGSPEALSDMIHGR